MINFAYKFIGKTGKKWCLFLIALLFFLSPSLSWGGVEPHPAESSAIDQVKETVDAILLILNEEHVFEEKWPEKKKEIVVLIKERFDFRELSMRALGKYWKMRTNEEKDYFVELFQDVLQNTYIDRLKTYSTEKIVFHKQITEKEKALVYCAFLRKDQEIPMKYRARKVNDSWLIYDIVIEGVSLVGNYRKQFEQIIRQDQYSGLVAKMIEKAKKQDENLQQ
ncbi:MAG: ABC transporter substrate-binding protein [Desulfobulbaceae bacterium]|uniref:ABC transporter substrate-binding protein n=1 Tax=Candidatus Desulfobia pelagia TaxID=2841692 RepID=A0A8J6TDH3_9BACT|nr:ABC transporter substrate-binding protein [Candidatus Desulfobia pelagia]